MYNNLGLWEAPLLGRQGFSFGLSGRKRPRSEPVPPTVQHGRIIRSLPVRPLCCVRSTKVVYKGFSLGWDRR